MSQPDWFAFALLAVLFFGLTGVASLLERTNRHLSNIADRLLDIEIELRKRR